MSYSTMLSNDGAIPFKRTWTPKEDASILRLVAEHGASNWGLIANSLNARTGKQCRERYHNHLQPNVKKGDWTEAEDRLIIELQGKYGNQWAKITKELPGRTDNAVKNRWHAAMRSQAKRAEAQMAKASKTVIPKLALGFASAGAEQRSSSGAMSARQEPATIADIIRKYSPRFESEMRQSDSVDLNMASHGHHMHEHEPVTARSDCDWNCSDYVSPTRETDTQFGSSALAALAIPCSSPDVTLPAESSVTASDLAELSALMEMPTQRGVLTARAAEVVAPGPVGFSEEYLSRWSAMDAEDSDGDLETSKFVSEAGMDLDLAGLCLPLSARLLSPRMISPRVSHQSHSHPHSNPATKPTKKRSASAAASAPGKKAKIGSARGMIESMSFDGSYFDQMDNLYDNVCF